MGPSAWDHLACLRLDEALNAKRKRASLPGSGSFPGQCGHDRRTDGGSKASASVPAGFGGVRAVVPNGDVVEGGAAGGYRHRRVQERGQRTYPLAENLVEASGEASPKRSHGASAADHRSLTIDVDVVAGDRVGIARNVGEAASDEFAGIHGWRTVGMGLISWVCGKVAYPSAGRAFLIRHFVPDHLVAVLAPDGR